MQAIRWIDKVAVDDVAVDDGSVKHLPSAINTDQIAIDSASSGEVSTEQNNIAIHSGTGLQRDSAFYGNNSAHSTSCLI